MSQNSDGIGSAWRTQTKDRQFHREENNRAQWWWKFWTPLYVILFCVGIAAIAVGILAIDRDGVGPRVVFSILAALPIIVSTLALYDMAYLCFYTDRDKDDRLGLAMTMLVPAAWTVAFALVHMVVWSWNIAGWEHMAGYSTFAIWLRFTSNCLNMVPDHDAISTLAHVVTGIFQFIFIVFVLTVTIAACVSIVLEHTKHNGPTKQKSEESLG